jgi:hypothetical protein
MNNRSSYLIILLTRHVLHAPHDLFTRDCYSVDTYPLHIIYVIWFALAFEFKRISLGSKCVCMVV